MIDDTTAQASTPGRAPLRIVRLDGIISPAPTFSLPHIYTSHHNTPYNDDEVITARLQNADVAITTRGEFEVRLRSRSSW